MTSVVIKGANIESSYIRLLLSTWLAVRTMTLTARPMVARGQE
jgi:hypothetical protein